jgi:hypothetical protein
MVEANFRRGRESGDGGVIRFQNWQAKAEVIKKFYKDILASNIAFYLLI